MKKLAALVLLLLMMAICFTACVDMDEALPHYQVTKLPGIDLPF